MVSTGKSTIAPLLTPNSRSVGARIDNGTRIVFEFRLQLLLITIS
jgi:hypothetical protein